MTQSPRERVVTFRPDTDTYEAMTRYREVVGVGFSEQIRRALREWLAERPEAGLAPKPATRKSRRTRT
jgi:hypothetical protein